MLNSINSTKKKFVATTLALAITFSSVASISYKSSDYLFLSASATETQDSDAEVEALINSLSDIDDERAELNSQISELEIKLKDITYAGYEAEFFKSRLDTKKERLIKNIQNSSSSKESAISNIFGTYNVRSISSSLLLNTKEEVYTNIYEELSNKITEDLTVEEAKEVIETVINNAYSSIDKFIEENYNIENDINAIQERINELEEEQKQIENSDEFQKYKEQEAVKEKYNTLVKRRNALNSDLKRLIHQNNRRNFTKMRSNYLIYNNDAL